MRITSQNSFDIDSISLDEGGRGSDPSAGQWVDVARIANLAEAGFIVDELIGMRFQARVHQVAEFSAAIDRWSAQYLIRVPEEVSAAAADHIRQYLSEEPAGRASIFGRLRESASGTPQEHLGSWRSVVILILVGVTSFLLGHQLSEQAAPSHSTSTDLATAVAGAGRPFISAPAANQPNFRLSFDRRKRLWTLSADRDHDGVYESTQHFTTAGAAR